MKYLFTFGIMMTLAFGALRAQCDLTATVEFIVCDDDGTICQTSDDIFFVYLEIGGSVAGWEADDPGFPEGGGTDGLYEFGPYPIASTPTIIIQDPALPDCEVVIANIEGGLSCDPTVPFELQPTVNALTIDDAGTPNQCSDDTYTANVTVNVIGTGHGEFWRMETLNGSQRIGVYGAAVDLGPFPLYQPDGSLNDRMISIQDIFESDCGSTIFLSPIPSATCDCEILAEATVIESFPGGTEDLCADDLLLLAVTAHTIGGNGSEGWNYSINGGGLTSGGDYGTPEPVGTYPFFGADQFLQAFDITITDAADASCSTIFTYLPPAPTEDCLCNVQLAYEYTGAINNNGTFGNCDDDFAMLTFTDLSNDVSGGYEILLDNVQAFTGEFGDAGGQVQVPVDDARHRLTMRSLDDYACLAVYDLPAVPSACPFTAVNFYFPELDACGQTNVCVPLRVSDFDHILGMQFSINYDASSLTYTGSTNFQPAMVGFTPASIGNPVPGNLTVTWNDPFASGLSLPNDAALVELCFDVLAGSTDFMTPITLSGNPTPAEVVNGFWEEIPFFFTNGNVSCDCSADATFSQGLVNDNGTPDCFDDSYQLTYVGTLFNAPSEFYDLLIDGTIVAISAVSGTGGAINVPADGQVHILTIRNSENPSCSESYILPAVEPACDPANCITATTFEVITNNNGTPGDPTDDTFEVLLNLEHDGSGSAAGWIINDNLGNIFTGIYGIPSVIGPYSCAVLLQIFLVVSDAEHPACNTFFALDNPLAGCGENFLQFSFESPPFCESEEFCVPLVVDNFTDILGIQFSVDYDPEALVYTGSTDFHPNLTDFGPPSVGNPAAGDLTVSWNDPFAAGVSLMDGDTLLSFCFIYQNEEGLPTEIAVVDDPVPIEIVDVNEEMVVLLFNNGVIDPSPIVIEACSTTELNCLNTVAFLGCDIIGGAGTLNYTWTLDGTLIADTPEIGVTAPGLYVLTVTDTNGCSATEEVIVTADFSVPDVVIETSGDLCVGGSVTLTALVDGVPTAGLWSTGEAGASIVVTAVGAYSVTYTDPENGCSTIADVSVTADLAECNLIEGIAYRSEDCLANGQVLAGWLVEVSGDNYLQYGYSDALGAYRVFVPPGTFQVRLIPVSPAWESCVDGGYELVFLGNGETQTQDLRATPLNDCPLLEVSMSVGPLRPCFSNALLTVAYQNVGTAALLDEGLIAVILPQELSYSTTTGTLINTSGDTLFFAPVQPLLPGGGGQFEIRLDVDCDAVLGSALCVRALGLPYGPCPGAPDDWAGGSLELTGECTEDEVIFTLRNAGDAPLSAGSSYIVIQDGVMLWEMPEEVPTLPPGESTTVSFPANGFTYQLEAEQEPFHPGVSYPMVAVEGCGTNEDGTFSTGFVTQLPNDEEDVYIDMDCRIVTASYDPNDKQAEPLGYAAEHYIEPERSLEYTIRFQNTGTDTAFTVIIRDTLNDWLDMSTLRPGVSSHAYRLELDTARALSFVFDDILLPDSMTNLEASQGFVEFKVSPLPDAPLGTRIDNTAGIYFDFNAPIITNTVFHTLGRDFLEVLNWIGTTGTGTDWRIFPNPSDGHLQLEWTPVDTRAVLLITDPLGRSQGRFALRGGVAGLDVRYLPPGWYALQLLSEDGKLLGSGKLIRR